LAQDLRDIKTIDQVIAGARERLHEGAFDYAAAGAGQEVTLARNTTALRSLAMAPSVLSGVSSVDTSAELLGMDLSIPVLMAPVGSLELFHPDGAAASAIGAAAEGTTSCVGILSSPTLEDVAERAGRSLLFQIYVAGDRDWLAALVERVERAGYAGICITADSPVTARRDRLATGGFDWRMEREGLPVNLVDIGRDRSYQASLSWSELDYLRTLTDLPILLKGVVRANEAARALDAGVDAIWVSNHGGRAMDHGLSSIEALRSVAGSVRGRAPIVVDSGFTRGLDICKAVALGASAVAIGRLQCWGLALGGAEGVARVLQILRAEIEVGMTMLGCSTVDDLLSVELHETHTV
jgi:isopentenyl diphosphate isomerase/L-lactate dehydrogenase-like FMN-dependent dehydrogenase